MYLKPRENQRHQNYSNREIDMRDIREERIKLHSFVST